MAHRAASRLGQRTGADHHGGGADSGAAGWRRHHHRNRVRPARHRQSGGVRGAAPRLSGDSGGADRHRRDLRRDQSGHRSHLHPGRSAGADMMFLRRLFRRRLVLLGALVLTLIIALAVFAPLLSPWSPTAIRVAQRLKPPSLQHWLGTDEFGRDILARIMFGARASLGIGLAVVAVSMACGTLLGLLAGYFRALDTIIMRLVDALMALPDILLAIFLVAVLGASAINVVLALSIVYTPRVTRVVRAST